MKKKKLLTRAILLLNLALLSGDKGHASEQEANVTPTPTGREIAAKLKADIHALRRNLVAGGPKVREADAQAINFYRKKAASYEKGMHSFRADIISTKAEYEAALDATLREKNPVGLESLARRAQSKRSQLSELELKQKKLAQQRDIAHSSITSIQKRVGRRNGLLAQFDNGQLLEEESLWSPALTDSDLASQETNRDPFDQRFLMDLARRDPLRARPIILQRNPDLYWQLWPLNPPVAILKDALPLPRIDQ